MRFRMLLFLTLLPLLSLGCGKSGVQTVPVTGQVTLDNQPLADATVRFIPDRSGPSDQRPDCYGSTDAEGTYTLHLSDSSNAEGALPGKYSVQIGKLDRSAVGGPRQRVPAKYSDENALSFNVTAEGPNKADFRLSSR